jgi:hypothetical protein
VRINVVYNSDGRITAAAVVPEEDADVRFGPLPGEGQSAAEIAVPEENRGLDLGEICTSFRVSRDHQDNPTLIAGDDSTY